VSRPLLKYMKNSNSNGAYVLAHADRCSILSRERFARATRWKVGRLGVGWFSTAYRLDLELCNETRNSCDGGGDGHRAIHPTQANNRRLLPLIAGSNRSPSKRNRSHGSPFLNFGY
jgi:hypothetical protein